jgi:hypothetical protein
LTPEPTFRDIFLAISKGEETFSYDYRLATFKEWFRHVPVDAEYEDDLGRWVLEQNEQDPEDEDYNEVYNTAFSKYF